MAKKPKKQSNALEWYKTLPVMIVLAVLALLLSYNAALLAIDTANMFAYTAVLIFLAVFVHQITLVIRAVRTRIK